MKKKLIGIIICFIVINSTCSLSLSAKNYQKSNLNYFDYISIDLFLGSIYNVTSYIEETPEGNMTHLLWNCKFFIRISVDSDGDNFINIFRNGEGFHTFELVNSEIYSKIIGIVTPNYIFATHIVYLTYE